MFFAHTAYSQQQDCFSCVENPLSFHLISKCCPENDSIPVIVSDEKNRLIENHHFHATMRMIQEPSTVSSITNWTINTYGYDKKNFILDGDLQFPISIGGGRFGMNTFQIIPRFRFRIFQDDPMVPFGKEGDTSLPVRTPSAMPGIAYYGTFRSWWSTNSKVATDN